SKGGTSFTGIEVSVASASLIGIDDFAFGIYQATVRVNSTSVTGGPKIDWQNATTMPSTPANLLPDLEIGSSLNIEAQGLVVLDAFSVLIAKGSFSLQLGTVTKDSAVYQAMALTLEDVEVFIGVGGTLDDNGTPTSFADDELNLDSGIGFHATLDELSLVTLKNNNATPNQANDDKSYMPLELSGFSAALVGIEGFKLGVFAAGLKLNQAKDTDTNPSNDPPKLDWTTFFSGATGLVPQSIPQVNAGVEIEAQGTLVLDAFSVVIVKGSFKLQLGTVIKDATVYQAMALTLGTEAFETATAVEVFIGVGGALEDNPGDTATPTNFADDELNLDSGIGFH